MKCPYCKEEVDLRTACPKCGRKAAGVKGVEVEYKDFRGSEMLDIRMPGSRPAAPAAAAPAAAPPRPSGMKGAGSRQAARTPKKSTVSKPLIAAVAAAIVLATIAGIFLLRFLLGY